MAYQTPTTANQMYEILKTIYYDYRLKIDAYEDAGLENLLLERMTFVEKSDEELFSIARELTAPWFDQEYEKAKRELDAKIQALVEKKERESLDVAKKIDALNEEVEKSKKEIEKEAIKRGYINSDVTVSKIVKLEENRLNKIEQIHQESKDTISNLDEEISALNVLAKSIKSVIPLFF